MDIKLRDQNERPIISDLTRKLVTSSSALLAEEPFELSDVISLAKEAPKIKVRIPGQEGSNDFVTVLAAQYCYAFVVGYPEVVNPYFGKVTAIDEPLSRFEVKLGVLKGSGALEALRTLRGREVDDNVYNAMLLGSAIYSWVSELNHCYGLADIIVGSENILMDRETRTQLPSGEYTIGFMNILVDVNTNKEFDRKMSTVTLNVEAEKANSSRSKKERSKKTDDVTSELEI